MYRIVQVILALLAVAILGVIAYVTFYNYDAALKSQDMATKLAQQRQQDLKDMIDMSTDINYNDKKLQAQQQAAEDVFSQLRRDIAANVQEQNLQLRTDLDIDNVKLQLSSQQKTLLADIMSTSAALQKAITDSSKTINGRIDDVQSKAQNNLDTNTNVLQTALQANIDSLKAAVTAYNKLNDGNVTMIQVALAEIRATVAANKKADEDALSAAQSQLKDLIATAEQHVTNTNMAIAATAADVAKSPSTLYNTLLQNTMYLNNDATGRIGIHTMNPNASLELSDSQPRVRLTGSTAGVELGSGSVYSRVMADKNYNMHLFTNDTQDMYMQAPNAYLTADVPATAGNGNVIIGKPLGTYKPATVQGVPNSTTPATKKALVNGSLGIALDSDLELGQGISGKGADNGKIGYQKWTPGALDITGAGAGTADRQVKVWAEAGTEFTGKVRVNSACDLAKDPNVANQLASSCSIASSNLTLTGSIVSGGSFSNAGNFSTAGNITSAGNISVKNTLTVGGTTSLGATNVSSGPLSVSSGASFGGGAAVTMNGPVTMTGTTVIQNGEGLRLNGTSANGGTNNYWIMHNPGTSASRTLILASSTGGSYDWTKQFTFDPSGNFNAQGNIIGGNIGTGGQVIAAGDVTAYGTVANLSDKRVKRDIRKIDDALAKLKTLSGYTFSKVDEAPSSKRHTGVIAQEVQQVLPEAINEMPNGLLTVSYGNMAGLIIEAIKNLDDKVTALQAEV